MHYSSRGPHYTSRLPDLSGMSPSRHTCRAQILEHLLHTASQGAVHLPAPIREPGRGATAHRRVHRTVQHRVAHRAPRPPQSRAGSRRSPREGGMSTLAVFAGNTEGRRGSTRRLDDRGCCLGILPEGGFITRRERADGRHGASLGVQETGCGTGSTIQLVEDFDSQHNRTTCRSMISPT
jgi:hypothetical protein